MNERVSTVELYCVDPQLSRNSTSDRSCSLWIPDISLMEQLNHDEYVWRRSMSDVPKVQTERASGSKLNWRRKMDLDTFGIWSLFRSLWVPKLGIWYHFWNLVIFWRLGTISGILALSLEYRSWNFDTCSKGGQAYRWYRFIEWTTGWNRLKDIIAINLAG